jgi:hypothetical protein
MSETLDITAPQSPTGGHSAGVDRPSSATPGPRRRGPYRFSEKRLAANRANALRSTGPRTQEGKERARLNAVRHGLRAALPADQTPGIAAALGEDSGAFRSLHLAFFEDLGPTNLAERQIVDRAARAAWRLRRADAMQDELIEQAVAERGRVGVASTGPEPVFAAVMAEQFQMDGGSPLLRLADYQFRFQSHLQRALRELSRLRDEQAKRRGSAAEQHAPRTNEPIRPEQVAPGTNEPIRPEQVAPRTNEPIGPNGDGEGEPTAQPSRRTNEPIRSVPHGSG